MKRKIVTYLFLCFIFSTPLYAKPFTYKGITYPQGKKSFADKIISFDKGANPAAAKFSHGSKVLGKPDFNPQGYKGMTSLGCNGSIIVKFTDNVLADSHGPDLYILEVGPALEDVAIEVSKDANNWVYIGTLKALGKKIDLAGKIAFGEAYYFVRLKNLSTLCDTDTRGADIDAIATLNPALDELIATPVDNIGQQPGVIALPVDDPYNCQATPDRDGDGVNAIACGGSDCDDNDSNRFPGNIEVSDAIGHDEDCDASSFGGRDLDGDGHVADTAFNILSSGEQSRGTDCDDNRANVHPNASEVCDGIDNNCDGVIDENVKVEFFLDNDGDLFGNREISHMACPTTEYFEGKHWVKNKEDCNDNDPTINPITGRCQN